MAWDAMVSAPALVMERSRCSMRPRLRKRRSGRSSIIASWMLLFSIFITELSMVILLYTADTRTFSVLSFEIWNTGNFSQVASLSLLQLVIGVTVLQTVQLLWPQRSVHG